MVRSHIRWRADSGNVNIIITPSKQWVYLAYNQLPLNL
jgi:hypothetical protein